VMLHNYAMGLLFFLYLSPPRWTNWTLEEIKRLVILSIIRCVYMMTHHHLHVSYTTGYILQ